MEPNLPFHVRAAVSNDVRSIVEAFDTTILYLEFIGSGAQWGSRQFSEKPGSPEDIEERIRKSEHYRLTSEVERILLFVIEAKAGLSLITTTVRRDSLHFREDGVRQCFSAASWTGHHPGESASLVPNLSIVPGATLRSCCRI